MINVYTDGACSGNPGPGGYGIVIMFTKKRVHMSAFEADTTNNRMELKAIITALKKIPTSLHNEEVHVYSDSSYAVKGINEWLPNWKAKGWRNSKNEPVKNEDLWKEFDKLVAFFSNINFVWVKGHANNEWNNVCDKLAVQAVQNNRGIVAIYDCI